MDIQGNHKRKINTQLLIPILGVAVSLLLSYLGFLFKINTITIFSLAFINVFLGIMFESFRVAKHPKEAIKGLFFLLIAFGIFFAGLYYFNANEQDFEVISFMMMIAIVGFFLVVIPSMNQARVTQKLAEGVTLLQSIAFIYWVLELQIRPRNYYEATVAALIAALVFYVAFHALTKIHLSKLHRFILSMWSSLIMLFFGIDYAIRVYNSSAIASASSEIQAINLGLQYFLFGAACIYIVNNIFMLIGFIPSPDVLHIPGEWKKYTESTKKLANQHIRRYSNTQVNSWHSLLCVLLLTTFFYLNHSFGYLHKHVAIFIAFLLFPILIELITFNHSDAKNLKTTINNT